MKKDASDSKTPIDPSLLFQYFNEIGIIAQLSNNMFENALPNDLTSAQFGVLNWFARVDSEATPGRLAAAFQVTGGAMTNTLKKLEARKLIKVTPDPHSGRKKRVTITAKGLRQREQAIATAAPLFQELMSEVDTQQLRAQLPALESLRKYLDERRNR